VLADLRIGFETRVTLTEEGMTLAEQFVEGEERENAEIDTSVRTHRNSHAR
jgi:hypothetical protein